MDCPICFDPIKDVAVELDACSHKYCDDCISEWSRVCPTSSWFCSEGLRVDYSPG